MTCQTESQGKQRTYTFYNGTNSVTTSNSSSNQNIINIQQAYEGQYFCEVTINGETSEKSSPQQIRIIGEVIVVGLLVVNVDSFWWKISVMLPENVIEEAK